MINEFQGWKFSEFVLDDGDGAITRWVDGLPDEVRIEIELRLIHWAQVDKFLDLLATAVELESGGKRFEELQELRSIEVLYQGAVYRILGAHFDLWEFVMLMPDVDPERRSKVKNEVLGEARRRLSVLRTHPGRRCDYEV